MTEPSADIKPQTPHPHDKSALTPPNKNIPPTQEQIKKDFDGTIALHRALYDESNERRMGGFTFQFDMDRMDLASRPYGFEVADVKAPTEADVRKAEKLAFAATLQAALGGLEPTNRSVIDDVDSLERIVRIYEGGEKLAMEMKTTQPEECLQIARDLFKFNQITLPEDTPDAVYGQISQSYGEAAHQAIDLLQRVQAVHGW